MSEGGSVMDPEESDVGDISEPLSELDNNGLDPIDQIEDESNAEEQSDESSETESEDDEQQVIETSKFKGQSKGVKITKENRSTPPFLTKYEKARVIGTRALQISKNSPIYVDPKDTSDPIAIAQQELYENKIPFIIRRYLPNGDFEDWELQELERLD